MPEGDTLFRSAAVLSRALRGEQIVRCDSQFATIARGGLEGHVVTAVVARGKNLLIELDDGRSLHTHLGMHGSWHLYRCGEPWQRSHRLARVVLETNRLVAVCFGAPTVRLLASPGQLARDPHLSTLGPDILAAEFERDRALANLRALPQLELGDALLHQRAVAGIGNVYKSETLFVCRLNPFARVDAVDDAALIRVLDESRAAIVRHATSSLPRQTRRRLTGPRVWVYRRAGEPCLVCGATVAMRRQGASSRSTYYCPSCQSVPPAETRRHPIGHGGV